MEIEKNRSHRADMSNDNVSSNDNVCENYEENTLDMSMMIGDIIESLEWAKRQGDEIITDEHFLVLEILYKSWVDKRNGN